MKPREGGLRRMWEKGEREQTTNKRGYIIERPKDCRARATWIEPLRRTLKSEIEKWWRVLNFAAHKSFLGSTWALRQWFFFCVQGLTEFLFRISLMMYLSIIKGMRQKLLWWLNGYVIFLYVIHSEDVESSNPHGHTNLVWIIHVTVTNVFRTDMSGSRVQVGPFWPLSCVKSTLVTPPLRVSSVCHENKCIVIVLRCKIKLLFFSEINLCPCLRNENWNNLKFVLSPPLFVVAFIM